MKKDNEEFKETLCCIPPPGIICCPDLILEKEENNFRIEDDFDNTITLSQDDMLEVVEKIKKIE